MQVKCHSCGFEQFVKDAKFNKHYRDSYEKAIMVLCGRNDCDKSHINIPNGRIREMLWLGSWSIIRDATLDEYKRTKRAKEIRDLGMKQCRKQ